MSMLRVLAASMICTTILAGSALAGPHSDAPAPGATPLDMRGPMQPDDGPAPDTERTWYGWKLLMADAAAVGMLAIVTDMEEPSWAPFLFFAGAGSAIHGLHGQGRKAAMSMAMRVALPVLGGFIGDHVTDDCHTCYTAPGLLEGRLVGMAAASLIDIAFLAHERRPVERRPEYGWTPTLGVSGSGFSAGINGWF